MATNQNRTLVDDPDSMNQVIEGGPNSIITDPHLCDSETLGMATQLVEEAFPDSEQEIIYFENNRKQCQKNAAKRKGKPCKNLIDHLSKDYNPPSNAMPVWRD